MRRKSSVNERAASLAATHRRFSTMAEKVDNSSIGNGTGYSDGKESFTHKEVV